MTFHVAVLHFKLNDLIYCFRRVTLSNRNNVPDAKASSPSLFDLVAASTTPGAKALDLQESTDNMELDITQILAELPVPPAASLLTSTPVSLFDLPVAQPATAVSQAKRLPEYVDSSGLDNEWQPQGKNVVIVPRPTYNSTANITKVLGYRDDLSEVEHKNLTYVTDTEEHMPKTTITDRGISRHEETVDTKKDDVSYVEAIVAPVAEDIVANFVPPEEFFRTENISGNQAAELNQDTLTSWSIDGNTNSRLIAPAETSLTAGLHVQTLNTAPDITLSGTFRAEDTSGILEQDHNRQVDQDFASSDEISLVGDIVELPESVVVKDGTLPAYQQLRKSSPAEARNYNSASADSSYSSAAVSPDSPDTTGLWTTPVINPDNARVIPSSDSSISWVSDEVTERHSPRLLASKEPADLSKGQLDTERSAKGALYKYYGNHEFVGMAKEGSQGDLSALVSYLGQQPASHKQARFVDSAVPAVDRAKAKRKELKSPIYIKQAAEIDTGRTEANKKSKEIVDMTTKMEVAVTTRKPGVMHRAGYSYEGFDFNDR